MNNLDFEKCDFTKVLTDAEIADLAEYLISLPLLEGRAAYMKFAAASKAPTYVNIVKIHPLVVNQLLRWIESYEEQEREDRAKKEIEGINRCLEKTSE